MKVIKEDFKASEMRVIQEDFRRSETIETLMSLNIYTECLVADSSKRASLRTTAGRITKEKGFVYSFKTVGNEVKVWRVK